MTIPTFNTHVFSERAFAINARLKARADVTHSQCVDTHIDIDTRDNVINHYWNMHFLHDYDNDANKYLSF